MRALLLPLFVAAATATAWAQSPGTTEIYLQRGADGRAVISDQPRRGVAVEKTWRMEREDPDDARERAARVRRDAAETSARVQRTIDAEQDRLALAEQERPVVVYPWLGTGVPRRRPPPGWQQPPRDRIDPPPRRGRQAEPAGAPRRPAAEDSRPG